MFVQLTEADTNKTFFLRASLVRRVMEGKRRTRVLFDDGFWRAGEIEVAETPDEVVARLAAASETGA